jgi:hypothetical protein
MLATKPLKGELMTRKGPANRNLTYLSGDSVTPIGITGFTVDEGDTSTFRVRYVAPVTGTYEVTITDVAGVEIDDDLELSPTLVI